MMGNGIYKIAERKIMLFVSIQVVVKIFNKNCKYCLYDLINVYEQNIFFLKITLVMVIDVPRVVKKVITTEYFNATAVLMALYIMWYVQRISFC